MITYKKGLLFFLIFVCSAASASEVSVSKISSDLSKNVTDESIWKNAKTETISLMAQPMALPRPKKTNTSQVQVQAVHDGQWIAFRIKWHADLKSEAGRLGQFSDAIAMQFPVKDGSPPPIFMGAKDNPVHIFHWRAQYQKDHENGKPEMRDLYPNMNPDMYPMEFKDSGHIEGLTDEKREIYSPGKASGNPQSYEKSSAVDEIFAEGFGSSSVVQNRMAFGFGVWKKGEWTVVISRPLKRENGSMLHPGKSSYIAFAVWQGGKQEVGSRKSVTMSWVPLKLSEQ